MDAGCQPGESGTFFCREERRERRNATGELCWTLVGGALVSVPWHQPILVPHLVDAVAEGRPDGVARRRLVAGAVPPRAAQACAAAQRAVASQDRQRIGVGRVPPYALCCREPGKQLVANACLGFVCWRAATDQRITTPYTPPQLGQAALIPMQRAGRVRARHPLPDPRSGSSTCHAEAHLLLPGVQERPAQ